MGIGSRGRRLLSRTWWFGLSKRPATTAADEAVRMMAHRSPERFSRAEDTITGPHRSCHAEEWDRPVGAQRYRVAWQLAEQGTGNLRVLAQALIAACKEVERESGVARADVAVRLIATQLARVCRVNHEAAECDHLVQVCRLRATGR